jgi:hypothetical protein
MIHAIPSRIDPSHIEMCSEAVAGLWSVGWLGDGRENLHTAEARGDAHAGQGRRVGRPEIGRAVIQRLVETTRLAPRCSAAKL